MKPSLFASISSNRSRRNPGASSRLSLPSLLASDCSNMPPPGGGRRARAPVHPGPPGRRGPRPPPRPPRPLAKASSAARTSWYRCEALLAQGHAGDLDGRGDLRRVRLPVEDAVAHIGPAGEVRPSGGETMRELDLGDRPLLLRERGQEGVRGVHDVGRVRRGEQASGRAKPPGRSARRRGVRRSRGRPREGRAAARRPRR